MPISPVRYANGIPEPTNYRLIELCNRHNVEHNAHGGCKSFQMCHHDNMTTNLYHLDVYSQPVSRCAPFTKLQNFINEFCGTA
jgi:hypothetical protein